MGFLKKITRPISRVLDKIVPNEIKPALPFLAAAAPFMAPGIMGAFGNSMLSRGLISGGLNLGSQLAQEGSDGDFSGLSTLMAAATGALSTPRTTTTMSPKGQDLFKVEQGGAADFFKNKAAGMEPGFAKSGLGALEGTSNYLTGVGDTLQNNLFSKEGLKAALVPVGQGFTDLAVAENRRALKDYEREQADYEAGMDEENSNRAFAIRQSMEAYGFTEQEILDAIEAAGYRAGGRVGLKGGGTDKMEQYKQYVSDMIKDGQTPVDFEDFLKMTDYKTGGRVGLKGGGMDASNPDFGGIPAAIENIQEDAEEMITIMTDNGPIEIEKSVYESMPGMFMDTTTSAYGDAGRGRPVPQFANGGRIGLKNGSDGSSTGSFGTDRYISEMLSEGNTLANRGENFMSEYDEMVKSGKIDSSIFDKLKEYKDMQKTEENLEKKFSNENLENVAEENLDKDALKYYGKKVNKLEKKFDDLNEKEEGIIALEKKTNFDASEITKTPDFQNWLRVYNSEDKMKAFDHPYADIYLSILDVKLKGRNESQRDLVGLADGGLMNLGGKEMDMRGGGFIPIGKKERADDVPARLSKNEFVMTADAVRAAGGGSVNEGAKRMYETMNRLEARA